MRGPMLLVGIVLLATLTGCQSRAPACPEATADERFLTDEEFAQALSATPAPYSAAALVEVGRKSLLVDRVVSGPLCNDSWRGTVYVTCDARVARWSETPTFLKYCNLNVEPGTVVYVAAHYNTAYYQGCSCHTGEIAGP